VQQEPRLTCHALAQARPDSLQCLLAGTGWGQGWAIYMDSPMSCLDNDSYFASRHVLQGLENNCTRRKKERRAQYPKHCRIRFEACCVEGSFIFSMLWNCLGFEYRLHYNGVRGSTLRDSPTRPGRYLGGLGVASSIIHPMSERSPLAYTHVCLLKFLFVNVCK
jgi:hypothetical protein